MAQVKSTREWCYPRDARCRPQFWGIIFMLITFDTLRFRLPRIDTKNYLTWFFANFQFAWWSFSVRIQNPEYEHHTGSSWGENCEKDLVRREREWMRGLPVRPIRRGWSGKMFAWRGRGLR